jgi:hypothetical protein
LTRFLGPCRRYGNMLRFCIELVQPSSDQGYMPMVFDPMVDGDASSHHHRKPARDQREPTMPIASRPMTIISRPTTFAGQPIRSASQRGRFAPTSRSARPSIGVRQRHYGSSENAMMGPVVCSSAQDRQADLRTSSCSRLQPARPRAVPPTRHRPTSFALVVMLPKSGHHLTPGSCCRPVPEARSNVVWTCYRLQSFGQ